MAEKVIKGRDLLLQVNGISVGCAETVEFSSSYEMVEAACRESGGYYDAEPGDRTATLSTDGVMKIDTPADPTKMRGYDLAQLHMDQTRINWVFGTDTTGEKEWYGEAYITEYSQSAPQKENGTYSVSLQVVGVYALRAVA
jgi:hypothetical protein